jgi:hypothetical protein
MEVLMKRIHVFLLSTVLILALGLQACSLLPDDLPKITRGSGKVVSEERPVEAFDSIQLDGAGEVSIEQGDAAKVVIEAEENILPQLTSEVKDGTLLLGYDMKLWKDRIIPTKTIKYTITVVALEGITINGAAELTNTALTADTFTLEINGAGDFEFEALTAEKLTVEISGGASVTIAGEVADQEVVINGAGSYDASDLKTLNTMFEFNGAGDGKVWALETLDIALNGAGSIGYYGSPQVSQSLTGLGTIEHLGDK